MYVHCRSNLWPKGSDEYKEQEESDNSRKARFERFKLQERFYKHGKLRVETNKVTTTDESTSKKRERDEEDEEPQKDQKKA